MWGRELGLSRMKIILFNLTISFFHLSSTTQYIHRALAQHPALLLHIRISAVQWSARLTVLVKQQAWPMHWLK